MIEKSGKERALILVKALPHVGKTTGETVCCAGVTLDRQWRRQYPIHFRRLQDQKFGRWQWIEYDWVKPSDDRRKESRRVQEHTIKTLHDIPVKDRAGFLGPLVLQSTDQAKQRGDTLALIRPVESKFYSKVKTADQLSAERAAYKAAASQQSFFDKELAALEPCPYQFHFDYKTADGKPHKATCDDWETSAMFYNLEKKYGTSHALDRMSTVFNEEYPKNGMVFAMGTHSQRPDQWLMVGVIRLDESKQEALL